MAATQRRKRLLLALLILFVIALAVFCVRRTAMLGVVRIMLDRDASVVLQERADGTRVEFAQLPSAWTSPMKNQMNEIWKSAGVEGVNYYSFAGPRTLFQTYSARSDARSPYYQAWVGAYVVRKKDGNLPDDLQELVRQLTALDQQSWLEAMGDPKPVAEVTDLVSSGKIAIDGSDWPLWHVSYRSHSDLSADPNSSLAGILGMPPKSSWPDGVSAFHDLTLDGYLAWRLDAQRRNAVVVYAVSASYPAQARALAGAAPLSRDDLLRLMGAAKLRPVTN